jgi:putative FmdB family regulatory protein
MPLYEYHCQACGEDFEKMVRFSEMDNTQECPHCQSQETHKKLSTFATRGFSTASSSSSSGSSCNSSGPFR